MSGGETPCKCFLATPPGPGAVAIVQVVGSEDEINRLLLKATGHTWAVGSCGPARLFDLDDGVVARINAGTAQLMPHGGVRIVQRLLEALAQHGATAVETERLDAEQVFPEAQSKHEAELMMMLARAESPLAIDVILKMMADGAKPDENALRHLIQPALVVLAGAANVGKSTLTNRLAGRAVSITYDMPGTTRDYTMTLIDLNGVVVRWHDTPGLRDTDDPIEREAQELAIRVMDQADVLISMTDAEHDWPRLPREPDLRICGKADVATRPDAALCVSAITGEGVAELVQMVRASLGILSR